MDCWSQVVFQLKVDNCVNFGSHIVHMRCVLSVCFENLIMASSLVAVDISFE